MVGVGELSLLHYCLLGRSQAGHSWFSRSMRLGLEVGQLASCPVSSPSMLLMTLLSPRSALRWVDRPPVQLTMTGVFLFVSILRAEGRMLLQP